MKLRSILALALALASGPVLAQVNPGTQPLSIAKGGTAGTTAAGARTNLGLGTLATQNSNNVAISGGTIGGMPNPSGPGDVANKSYVDATATGLNILAPSTLATAAVLPNTPTYANGASGVGATLTAGSNTTLTVDGTAAPLTTVVLVKNQASSFQNGVYTVTQAGSGAAPWILTRATYFDQAAEMRAGSYSFVTSGATNLNTSWTLQTAVATVGTDALNFVLFSAAGGVASVNGQTGALSFSQLPGGIVSPATGDPNPETDVASTSTLYLVTVESLNTEAWNGSNWVGYTYSGELTLTLTAGAHLSGKNYDVFESIQGGVPVLCTGPPWTNDTTRSSATEIFQGREVNSVAGMTCINGGSSYTVAARAGRLRGGFRASANGVTKSTKAERLVCDRLRPTVKAVRVIDTTDTWPWSTASLHQANASSANQIAIFNCASGRYADISVAGYMINSTATVRAAFVGIGLDSSSVDSSITRNPCAAGNAFPVLPCWSRYVGNPGIGYHELRWLEQGNGNDIQNWVGDNGSSALYQTGLTGTILQ